MKRTDVATILSRRAVLSHVVGTVKVRSTAIAPDLKWTAERTAIALYRSFPCVTPSSGSARCLRPASPFVWRCGTLRRFAGKYRQRAQGRGLRFCRLAVPWI